MMKEGSTEPKRGAMQRKYWFDYLFSGGGLFLLVLFFGKFYYLMELKLPLSYDESYYWDWSRKLDWGYYSKPPMVAWLIYLSTSLFGATELAVRLPALLSQTGFLVIFYVLAFRYYGELVARKLLFTLAFVPIFFLYSFIMTIDPPLLFFWALFFYGFVEYLRKGSLFWSLFSGVALGCALLTKQTSFILYLLSLIYLFLFERKLFSQPKSYLLFLTALLLYFPNLYWNIKHQFLLFKHTEEHFQRLRPEAEYYFNFWIGLFLLFGPLFISLFFYQGFSVLRKLRIYLQALKRNELPYDKFLLKILLLSFFFSFPPLLFFILASFFTELNHNWIMPFFSFSYLWVTLLSLQRQKMRLLFNLNLLLCASLSFLLLVLPLRPELFGIKAVLLFKKFYGWKELAKAVEPYYRGDIPIVVSSRELASSLAFYLPSHPEIYVVRAERAPQNQYHLWRETKELIGKEVLFIQKGSSEPPYLEKPKTLERLKLNFYGMEKSFSIWQGTFKDIRELEGDKTAR